MPKSPERAAYKTLTDTWIDSTFHAEGVTVHLTEDQAKYYLLSGAIAPDTGEKEPAPARRRSAR